LMTLKNFIILPIPRLHGAIIVFIIEFALVMIGVYAIFRLEKKRPTKTVVPATDKDVKKIW